MGAIDIGILQEIGFAYDKIKAELARTTDPAKREQLRKDMENLKDEYRIEICGM